MSTWDGDGTHPVPLNFRVLFAAIPTAYLVMTPDLIIAEANAAYLDVVGRSREDLVGRPVFEAFPPTPDALDENGLNPLQLSFERARDRGQPDVMPIHKYDVVDPISGEMVERFWSLISAPVLDEDGTARLVLQRVEDVTDYVREREGRQAEVQRVQAWQRRVEVVEADLYARLQELRAALEAKDLAARRLASFGDLALQLTAAATVEDLERIVIGRGLRVLGADGGAVISLEEDGGWRVTVNAALGEHVQVKYGNVPYDSPLPACWTARTSERLLLPTRASGSAFHEVMAAVYADTRRYGWAFLPLMVQDKSLGSLAVAWSDEHQFRPDELDLLDGFAAQCAQTLERIRATQAQRKAALAAQRMSETLQRSLLTQPPTPDSLRIAVRYQPAAQEAQIGGDWYDAFVTAADATLLVIGDVNGHDRTAAAMMGQVRNLLRGMAYDSDDGPAVLLSRLDVALRGLHLDTLATAVLARVEQSATDRIRGVRRLRWSNAGHPPPLLRQPDGTVQILDGEHDLLLGLDPGTSRREHVVELVAGSTLLLFTDGLVERRATSLDDGVARLAEVLAAEGWQEPEVLCDRLLASIGLEANDDDIALLVLRLAEQVGQDRASETADASVTEVLTLSADPRAVREARQLTARLCALAGLIEDVCDTAVLLTSEVVTNAVMHGRSQARIVVTVGPREVLVEVGDDNSRPPVLQPHDEDALGGRGVGLLEVAASAWGVRDQPVGKVVWFALRIA